MRLAAAATEPAPAIAPQANYVKLPVTPLPEVDVSDLATLPRVPRKPVFQGRSVPTMLIVACLLLLVATSIFAYVFINKKPELPAPILTATPGQLRVNDVFILAGNNFGARDVVDFTRDVNVVMQNGNGSPLKVRTDETGNFSVQITVQPDWSEGQHLIHATDEAQQLSVSTAITIQQAPPSSPRLQLLNTSINFGTSPPGKSSTQNIILTNAGGGQLTWQASSDQTWLSVTPSSGTFSGKAIAVLMVNRGALAAQTYNGNVKFTQQDSTSAPLILHVTMSVQAVPASLIVSSSSLIYSGSTIQNPPDQTIILQNSGNRPLDWSSRVTTGNGTPWLSIRPTSGHLEVRASAVVTVSASSTMLAVGSYQGALNFKGGANPQVTVVLSVAAPGNLLASPPAINVKASTGQNAATQTITLQNSGGQPLDWKASETTADGANWLSAIPSSGHLEPNAKANVTVKITSGSLKAGSYQGTLTFSYGALTKQVAVALTLSTPPAASIGVQTSTLAFTTTEGTDPASQTFTITDTGNATLNWSLTEDASGTTYAPATPASGSLAPGQSQTITVTPNVAQAGPGVINATIIIADSDVGTTVQSQQVGVSISINKQTPGILGLSTNNLAFSNTTTLNNTTQLLVITNNGIDPLDWSITSSDSWLSTSDSNGTLVPGESVVIDVTCASSSLAVGNYDATLTITGSNSGTAVAAQTVNVTLTVSP